MRTINLTTLPPEVKRPVWQAIQTDAPALASLLQEEELRAIATTFNATTHVDLDQLPPSAIEIIKQWANNDTSHSAPHRPAARKASNNSQTTRQA